MHTLIQLIKKCPPLLAVIQWLLRTLEQVHQLYLKLCWQIFVRLPLKERKVIFCNFYGRRFWRQSEIHCGGNDPPGLGL